MPEKIYDPQYAVSEGDLVRLADLVAVVRQLRRDCPWDRRQTHASVRHLLIEEAYEVVDAVEGDDMEELKKELGDVLLHVLFHSAIAEEAGRFTLEEVARIETEKLVRRHPHVFGETAEDEAAEDETAVLKAWEEIKQAERAAAGGEAPSSTLDGVPSRLPALLRAERTQEKAAGVGFDFPEKTQAWQKVEEETAEFRALAHAGAPAAAQEEELGDLFFALVNYARLSGLHAENALRGAVGKFARRFRHVERRLAEEGRSLTEADLDEMNVLWDEAKEGG